MQTQEMESQKIWNEWQNSTLIYWITKGKNQTIDAINIRQLKLQPKKIVSNVFKIIGCHRFKHQMVQNTTEKINIE
jgi:hypothetical protein